MRLFTRPKEWIGHRKCAVQSILQNHKSKINMFPLQSERLLIKPTDWDTEFDYHYQLSTDADMMRFIRAPETSVENYRARMEKYALYFPKFPALGLCSIFLKNENNLELIGNCIMRHLDWTPNNPLEIGYKIDKKHWNSGLGSEAAGLLVEHLSKYFPDKKIVALTDMENIASQKVLLNNHFQETGTHDFESVACKLFTYSQM